MPELIAKTALQDQAPLHLGGLELTALTLGPLTGISLYHGRDAGVDQALSGLGLGFPAPGTFTESAGVTLAWNGRDQALLIGAPPPEGLEDLAAVTAQSGGSAGLSLRGDGAAGALARLVSIDLRPAAFPPGSVARTGLNHIPALILAREGGYDILVFRSMARSAWDELAEVMQHLAARQPAKLPLR